MTTNNITGIICALEVEAQNLKDMLSDKHTETVSGIEFSKGRLCGKDTVIAVCGVGKVFAAVCAQTMILQYGVSRIINTGVAGTLTDRLHIGDIVIASSVVEHDMDTSALGDPIGMISGINIINFETDKDAVNTLTSICKQNSCNCIKGVIACGDQFIDNKIKKASISDRFGAVACDMESGAIGHVCYINKVPFTVIRVISDEADGKACSNYNKFVKESAKTGATITSKYISN